MSNIQAVVDFWDARPCNVRHSTKAVGSKEYFDEVEKRKYFVEPHIPLFAEFEKWSGKRVLEVGCGIGTDTINFLRAGADLIAIDVSSKSVELAKARAKVFGFSDEGIRLANVEDLSHKSLGTSPDDQPYDLIYSFGVIHHTPNPKKAIECLAILQESGGELRLMLYSKVSYKALWAMHTTGRWNIGEVDDVIREFAEAQTGCPVAYTYTFDEVAKLLAPWYKIVSIKKDHIFRWDIEKYIKHEYVLDEAWKDVSEDAVRAWESELGWHTLIIAEKV